MSILLLNCGSSSIKYQVIDGETATAVGLVERIGQPMSNITHKVADQEHTLELPLADHSQAVAQVLAMFTEHGPALDSVQAVGHRVVHGGSNFIESTVIDEDVVERLAELSSLAPLHNPPALAGIKAAVATFGAVPHVAIFDTSFFSTLPPEAHTYAIPTALAAELGIRRYGFHGTSHGYIAGKTAEFMGRDDLKLIICHLGNGASVSAVDSGVAKDTSMGLTPLQGLVMGTRSGDVDPGLHAFLARHGKSVDEIDTLLNKQSGMLGLCGVTDMRDVEAKVNEGDEAAILARDVYLHRLVSYIGSYYAVLGGVDALVLTAGVGENSAFIREGLLERLRPLGFHVDSEKNAVRSKEPRYITADDSPIPALVIPTNEEQAMADDIRRILSL